MKFIGSVLRNSADALYRISPRFYYGIRYFAYRHKWPSFESPTDLSEWLLAEMLKDDFSRFAVFVDKVKVRDYVKQKGLSELLPELYGAWANVNDIDFEHLPTSFALKANNGCGGHVICANKDLLDMNVARRKMDSQLATRFSIREPHYKFISPLAFAEEYIGIVKDGQLPVDYKFHCVKGKVNCVLTCSNRNLEKKSYDLALFDPDWNVLRDGLQERHNQVLPPRPVHLDEMIKYAEKLSEDFDFVRVDLYDTRDKIYFGELTFTPASSLLPYFTTVKLQEMVQPLLK